MRETRAYLSRLARGHLRVSGVLLDGPSRDQETARSLNVHGSTDGRLTSSGNLLLLPQEKNADRWTCLHPFSWLMFK